MSDGKNMAAVFFILEYWLLALQASKKYKNVAILVIIEKTYFRTLLLFCVSSFFFLFDDDDMLFPIPSTPPQVCPPRNEIQNIGRRRSPPRNEIQIIKTRNCGTFCY